MGGVFIWKGCDVMAHIHSVYDSDSHFAISPITRTITNMSSRKTTLMQFDHNSERFTFELPRYIEGHDMSTCNRVEVHYLNIDATTKAQNEGVYEVEDLQVSPEDDNIVICSWLISQNATQYVGSINFILRFVCTSDNATNYAWHTAIFSGISVSTGMNNGEAVIEEYPDVLQQWYDRLMDVGLNRVIDARNEAINDIESMTTEKAEFLSKTGGTIVSEDEPEGEHIDIWVNPNVEGDDVQLLEASDIVQELSDATDKVPSAKLLNTEITKVSGFFQNITEGVTPVNYAKVANNSQHANTADEADRATHDDNGNVIHDYYVPTHWFQDLEEGRRGVKYAETADEATYDDGGNNIRETYATKAEVTEQLGNIDTALDNILAIQNTLIGGDA